MCYTVSLRVRREGGREEEGRKKGRKGREGGREGQRANHDLPYAKTFLPCT